jgi:hypothetical protein
MSLSSEDGMVMPVAPMYGSGNCGGFGGFGGDGWWVILFLFSLMGNWGNGFGGGNNGTVLPYMMNQATQDGVSRGFDTASISSQLAGISAGITNGFANAEVAACNRTIDAMNQRFADTSALQASLNNVGMSLQNCCCENRAGLADLKYAVATENCADRQALNEGIRDIMASNTANTQAILDKLCALELDGYKRENDNLRSQLNMATLAASQTAQNAFIQQGFSNEVDQLYNRLNSCPVPTTPVYGRTPIFTCNNGNSGCGCACGGF